MTARSRRWRAWFALGCAAGVAGIGIGVASCGDGGAASPEVLPPDATVSTNPVDEPDAGPDARSSYWWTEYAFEPIRLTGDAVAATELRFIPGTEDEFLLLERPGKVRHYRLRGDHATLLGAVDLPEVHDEKDCGLISLAFDPNFLENHHVYFGYCASKFESRVSRHAFVPGDYEGLKAGTTILEVGHPEASQPWHNVGAIGFDKEGALWAAFGDKTIPWSSQDTANNLGSLVRVIPGADGGYTVPDSNPFVGDAGDDDAGRSEAVYAYGLRSPWRVTLDSRGRYWIGDVGQSAHEEVSLVQHGGENFGWPLHEGPCGDAGCGDTTGPLVHWGRSLDEPRAKDDRRVSSTRRRVAWVGPEYSGTNDRYDGKLTGRILYGDSCSGWIRAIDADDAGAVVHDEHLGHLLGVVSWDEGADGYLYVATYGDCESRLPNKEAWVYRMKRTL